MDIMDEVLENDHYSGGKSGFNQSDVNAVKRFIAAGHSCDDIARAVGIQYDLVEKFIESQKPKKMIWS